MQVIEGLYYTKEHEWIKIDDNTATIGIADHAQEALGEITYVELPEIGKQVNAGEELAVVESTKAASDIYSPIAGKVTEVNDELESQPDIINKDCYGAGWIVKLQITGENLTEALMNAEEYKKFASSI